jgi:hypothetical protein
MACSAACKFPIAVILSVAITPLVTSGDLVNRLVFPFANNRYFKSAQTEAELQAFWCVEIGM